MSVNPVWTCDMWEGTFEEKIELENGIYRLDIQYGCEHRAAVTTLKYGKNRMLLYKAVTKAGAFAQRSALVKVTDGVLSLIALGTSSCIHSIIVTLVKNAADANVIQPALPVTVFLAGDSTVTDQDNDPYAGWGQALPLFLHDRVVVDNHAESGRSTKSFMDEGRLAAILTQMNSGDYLFIQFGHNDEKPDEERATKPFGTFKENLAFYVKEARARGANPVLLTPMHRRKFDENGCIIDTHGDYLTGVRQVAREHSVPLIDLAEKSRRLYESYGDEPSKALFVWLQPEEHPNHPEGVEDDTHFCESGAVEMAGLVVEGLQELRLPLLE